MLTPFIIGGIAIIVTLFMLDLDSRGRKERRDAVSEMLKDMNLNELEKLIIKGQLMYGPFFSLQSASIDEIRTLVEETVEDKNLSI